MGLRGAGLQACPPEGAVDHRHEQRGERDDHERDEQEDGAGGHGDDDADGHDRHEEDGSHSRQLPLAAALPPLRPAAAFWALVPPWLLVSRRLPEPDALPPLLEALGSLAIRAARSLLMPFLRRPSYCLSFLTLGPWSLAMEYLRSSWKWSPWRYPERCAAMHAPLGGLTPRGR